MPPSGNSLLQIRHQSRKSIGKHLRQRNIEPLLNLLEHGLVILAADKGDTETLGTETAGATDPVEVGVRVTRQVVIDGQVYALDVDTSPEDVRGDADTSLELFEFLVAFDTTHGQYRLQRADQR